MSFKKYFIYLCVLTLAISAIMLGLKNLSPLYVSKYSWFALLFFVLLSILVFGVTAYGMTRDNKTFIKLYFGGSAIRFLFCLGFLLIYLLFRRPVDLYFIATFLFLYILFTMFEIYSLMTKLRPDSKNKSNLDV